MDQPITQAGRPLVLTTPLGTDVLLLESITGTEEFGRPFIYELSVLSARNDITFEEILGQKVSIEIQGEGGRDPRYISGYVCRFTQTGQAEAYTRYRAQVVPWLWFLTRTSDCKIFQEMTVPDIILQVMRDLGFSDIDDPLDHGQYRTWNFCVQYRETAFNFVSRLMEQEGIYYYFRHEQDKHTLVLCDSSTTHDRVSGLEQVPFYPPTAQFRDDQSFRSWHVTKQLLPGAYHLRDFNYTNPNAPLDSPHTIFYTQEDYPHSEYEIFDYPGEFTTTDEGDRYSGVRADELIAQFERITAQTDARGLVTGSSVELTDPSNVMRDDQPAPYVIIGSTLTASQNLLASGRSDTVCDQTLTLIREGVGFRTARTTPKPVVQGPQTAIVTEASGGNKMNTDKYGCVKVKFHWDRHGSNDENSSCWVRVSQAWAGQGWGAMALPHAGQEVIVEFLEGDPDQPIITGRVYNETNKPYLDPPGNATMFTIRDHGGDRFVLDGKTGEQVIEIFSPTSNSLLTMGDDKTRHKDAIDVEAKRPFGGSDAKADKGIKLQTDDHIVLHAGKDIVFDGGANWMQIIGSDWKTEVKGHKKEDITKNVNVDVGGNVTVKIKGKKSETVETVVEEWTYSDKSTYTYGSTFDMFAGTKTGIMLGQVNSLTVGNTNSAFIGLESSAKLSGGISIAIGAWIEITMALKLQLSLAGTMSIAGGATLAIDAVSKDELGPFNKETKATKMTNALVNLIGGGTVIVKNGALMVV